MISVWGKIEESRMSRRRHTAAPQSKQYLCQPVRIPEVGPLELHQVSGRRLRFYTLGSISHWTQLTGDGCMNKGEVNLQQRQLLKWFQLSDDNLLSGQSNKICQPSMGRTCVMWLEEQSRTQESSPYGI